MPHTQFPNDILDALIRAPLPSRELRITLAVARKTYGWQKVDDAISLTILAKMTGISKPHCSEIMASLIKKRVIRVTGRGNRGCKKYSINKTIREWLITSTVPDSGNHSRTEEPTVPGKGYPTNPDNGKGSVSDSGNKSVPPEGNHKININTLLKKSLNKDSAEASSQIHSGSNNPESLGSIINRMNLKIQQREEEKICKER